jgi:hypothetical protein
MAIHFVCRPSIAMFLVLGAALVGCGPTRTAGTQGLAANQLAVLEVDRHNAIPGLHIDSITIDDDQNFDVTRDRTFYLTPGEHKVAVGYGQCVHGPPAWFSPASRWNLFASHGGTTMQVEAGKRYELSGWKEGIGSLMHYLHKVVEKAGNDTDPP